MALRVCCVVGLVGFLLVGELFVHESSLLRAGDRKGEKGEVAAPLTKWEYRVVMDDDGATIFELSKLAQGRAYHKTEVYAAAFNQLGQEGWEFVSRVGNDMLVFKRPQSTKAPKKPSERPEK